MVTPILAIAIAAATLLLILTRPRRLPEPVAAMGGALAMLACGLVDPPGAAQALLDSWNVFLFFLGLMVASCVAEQAGVFEVAAGLMAQLAGGSARWLLVWVYLLGVLVTTFLSNDATALLLTPVVFTLARRLKLPPLPYAYACALSANAASFVLPVSNPANLLVLAGAPMSLGTFVRWLWLPSVASATITLAGLLALTWMPLDQRFPHPATRPITRRAWLGGLGLAVLATCYLLSDRLGVPLGVVACGGALLLLLLDALSVPINATTLVHEVSWSLLILLAGLTIVVEGLVRSGVTSLVALGLDSVAQFAWLGAAAVGLGTAVLSNVINNLPMALVTAAALHTVDASVQPGLAAGAIVGIDLGPNLTTVGSFATMLWLMLLRRRGIDISARAYGRVGLLVTPPALLAALLALGLTGG